MPTDDATYVYKITLKKRYGLTDAMIRNLGEPDKTVPNPHYRSGPPSSLYLVARVEQWCDENAECLAKAKARRSRLSELVKSRHAKTKKREHSRRLKEYRKLMEWCSKISVEITPLPDPRTLWVEANQHYAGMYWDAHDTGPNGLVAYVRHNYTNYHDLLLFITEKEGEHEAYDIVRTSVDRIVRQSLVECGALDQSEAICDTSIAQAI